MSKGILKSHARNNSTGYNKSIQNCQTDSRARKSLQE